MRGRPSLEESEHRRMQFIRLVAAGVSLVDATAAARIKPERALKLLDTSELRQIIAESEAREPLLKAA